MSKKEYYDTLGLPTTAGKPEIRKAFRVLALKYHPDINPAISAKEQYERIRSATEALLGQGSVQNVERPRAGNYEASLFQRLTRNPRFPLYFSAASLLCGCVIFVGALRVHDNLYGYGNYDPNAGPIERTAEQQRIADLLQQHTADKQTHRGAPS